MSTASVEGRGNEMSTAGVEEMEMLTASLLRPPSALPYERPEQFSGRRGRRDRNLTLEKVPGDTTNKLHWENEPWTIGCLVKRSEAGV